MSCFLLSAQMGRILECVLLLSSLSIISGAQPFRELSLPKSYDRGKQGNLTFANSRQFFPKDQNVFFSRKIRDNSAVSSFHKRRRLPPLKIKTKSYHFPENVGLSAFYSKDPRPTPRKRLPPLEQSKNRFNSYGNSLRKNVEPSSDKYARFSTYNRSNSLNYQPNYKNDLDKSGSSRRYRKEGRNPRLHQLLHASKYCDPCNNVPWVPVVKVSDSYRQQRNHPVESHQISLNTFNYDFKASASNDYNILFPYSSLVPPIEPILDGTISSSFGLPIGNIPMSHGLLAPLNHVERYGANSIDFSNSVKYFTPQTALESNPIPELSPVPLVPIHESTQFYQFDPTATNLIPPPKKTIDVSNIVLTISEDNSDKSEPPEQSNSHSQNVQSNLNDDMNVQPSAVVDYQSSSYSLTKDNKKVKNQSQNSDGIEFIKSIPLAEYTSSIDYSLPPSSYPSQQIQFIRNGYRENAQKPGSENIENDLVPPPVEKKETDSNVTSSQISISSYSKSPEVTDASVPVPKPLTSPSLSWLFPNDLNFNSKAPNIQDSTTHSFISDSQEIASIVNSELRPVSPYPSTGPPSNTQNSDNSKGKKIQIIIPYITKNKDELDSNAVGSVRHEVVHSVKIPANKTSENVLRDPATSIFSSLPDRTHSPQNSEVTRDKKLTYQASSDFHLEDEKGSQEHHPVGDLKSDHKYLTEMHHIIASNIRELLFQEIEKSQNDQNTLLQDNIDNWTALEYSNHKTVGTKAPKEVISQALAVTSIPGTSISHLLLPSKKIPNEYFVTTPLPVFDEPHDFFFNATNSSVNSRPFTAKPYATTSLYVPSTSSRKESFRQSLYSDKNEESRLSNHNLHERNYTEVGRRKVNNWSRLNENLVLPESRSSSKVDGTTSSPWTHRILTSSGQNEKVEIVTPVYTTRAINTTYSYRRTTRHVRTTEKAVTTSIPKNKNNETVPRFRFNTARLERLSNYTFPFNRKSVSGSSNSTTQPTTTGNQVEEVIHTTEQAVETKENSSNSSLPDLTKNVSSEIEPIKPSNKSEQFSINDVFPFRNKEFPWKSSANLTEETSRSPPQRTSIVKQVSSRRSKTTGTDSS